jgi:hypothetical protein
LRCWSQNDHEANPILRAFHLDLSLQDKFLMTILHWESLILDVRPCWVSLNHRHYDDRVFSFISNTLILNRLGIRWRSRSSCIDLWGWWIPIVGSSIDGGVDEDPGVVALICGDGESLLLDHQSAGESICYVGTSEEFDLVGSMQVPDTLLLLIS